MNNYVYYIGNKIYINLTNQCSNRCEFCIRKSANQKLLDTDLWIDADPTAEDILEQLPTDLDSYDSEIVFCGYGEPTYNIEALAEVSDYLHCIDKSTRVNTNGQGMLIAGDDCAQILCDCCDTISISLNAPTATKYDQLCHSIYGTKAFDAIIDFAKKCKNKGANVILSIVDVLDTGDTEQCKKLAQSLDLPLRIRNKE